MRKPNVTEIIGLQYGDEGKGKVSCHETPGAELVIRSTGGNNAGHTVVYKGQKYALHLVPSGIVTEGAVSILAPGMVIDPQVLINEIGMLKKNGVKVTPDNLKISDRARIIMPYHREMDLYKECCKSKEIGTTKSGIGPAYASKADRIGLRMIDLQEGNFEQIIKDEISTFSDIFAQVYLDLDQNNYDQYLNNMATLCDHYRAILYPYICNTQRIVNEAIIDGKKIVIEGAQAFSLDLDHGDYPFVTSSNPNASGTASAVCIGPRNITEVIGVIKAYTSRVGEGPFITEQINEVGTKIRELGHEFGTTTGRPRRCGWLDLVQVRDAVIANSVSCLAVNHIDTIGKLREIKVCVGYQYKGERIRYVPTNKDGVEPIYSEPFPGWEIPEDCKTFEQLPREAQNYIGFIENYTGVKVKFIGIGPKDEDTIIR